MKWAKQLLSKDESGVSFGHVACCFVVFCLMMMSIYSVSSGKPMSQADIPAGWVYVVGILWGTQKVSEALAAKKGDKEDAQ